jgi:hypothetical protein
MVAVAGGNEGSNANKGGLMWNVKFWFGCALAG